jgi:hypothetical protein
MAALCPKLCHLKDKDVISFTVFIGKGENEIKVRKGYKR